MAIRAVWFDVGEALIDETREYGTWADWLGIPRHTFSAVFGAVIANGGDYREVFQYFRPGFDLEKARRDRFEAGLAEYLNSNDLYDDVRPCLRELQNDGYFVGIAGNQTARAGRFIRELHLPADVIATSSDWGASKPDKEFFEKLVDVSGHREDEILYVGDRRDNDISPASDSGLRTALIKRGPWGYILKAGPLSEPDVEFASLAELPHWLRTQEDEEKGSPKGQGARRRERGEQTLDTLRAFTDSLVASDSAPGEDAYVHRRSAASRARELVAQSEHVPSIVDVDSREFSSVRDVEDAIPWDRDERLSFAKLTFRVGIAAALGAGIAGPAIAAATHSAVTSKLAEAAISGAVGQLASEAASTLGDSKDRQARERVAEVELALQSIESSLQYYLEHQPGNEGRRVREPEIGGSSSTSDSAEFGVPGQRDWGDVIRDWKEQDWSSPDWGDREPEA